MAPIDLELRARRAYELGRLQKAAQLVLFIVPLGAAALLIGRPPPLVAAMTAALSLLCVGLAFARSRHQGAALIGLLAALPPLLLPWAVRGFGRICTGDDCTDWCLPACLGGGAAAGLLIGLRIAAQEQGRFWFGAVALAVAALAGSLGCTLAGTAGVAGMLAGLAIGTTPAVLRSQVSGG